MSSKPPAKTAPVEGPLPAQQQQQAGPNRWILVVAIVIAAMWILGLLILAVVSSNPVTLNRTQIQYSDYIVTARRPKADADTLVVEKEWLRNDELSEITLTNLDETGMPADEAFLVPLQRLGGGRYRVTPTSLPNKAALIYPATEEAQAQLREILEVDR